LAVLRLITNSNLVGCITGISAGKRSQGQWKRATLNPLLLEGGGFCCGLRLMGILAIRANLWGFRRFGLGVFRACHLVPLQPADFLTPAIIGPLG
jgi:hypothetical protein